MIEPDNRVTAALPRPANGVKVSARIDEKVPRAIGGEVGARQRLEDVRVSPEQQAAALLGRGVARVGGDGIQDGAADADGRTPRQSASTAMAMPMPPPMHNEATP